MGRWGGLLAGLGIGVLLASLFGAQLGPIIGLLLAVMLAVGVIYLLLRLFAGKRPPAAARSPQFAGIGSGVPEAQRGSFQGNATGSSLPAAAPVVANLPADFEMQPFLRVAKSSFIRLQAANDAGDLADIRDYTTPEMFAEISLQMQERGGAGQKTEVVSLEAQLLDAAQEDGFDYASVRFYGLIRENAAANPEPFDEIWHVRRKAGDRKDPWLIAGIQQNPQ
jgi:predicted lipid-binding transport protein (Tim44 family)